MAQRLSPENWLKVFADIDERIQALSLDALGLEPADEADFGNLAWAYWMSRHDPPANAADGRRMVMFGEQVILAAQAAAVGASYEPRRGSNN